MVCSQLGDMGADLRVLVGAGEGNRTLMTSLEGWGSTIELRPHRPSQQRWSPPRRPGQSRVAYRLRRPGTSLPLRRPGTSLDGDREDVQGWAPGCRPGADIRQHDPGCRLARLQCHRGVVDADRQRVLAAGPVRYGMYSATPVRRRQREGLRRPVRIHHLADAAGGPYPAVSRKDSAAPEPPRSKDWPLATTLSSSRSAWRWRRRPSAMDGFQLGGHRPAADRYRRQQPDVRGVPETVPGRSGQSRPGRGHREQRQHVHHHRQLTAVPAAVADYLTPVPGTCRRPRAPVLRQQPATGGCRSLPETPRAGKLRSVLRDVAQLG